MKRWWWVVGLCLSLGLNAGILTTLAFQKTRSVEEPGTSQPPPPDFRRLADRLDLTGQPRIRLGELQRRLMEEVLFHRRAVEQIRQDLRHELRRSRPEEARVNQLVSELAEHYAALEGALAHHILEARELLPQEKERLYLEMVGRFLSRQEPPRPRGMRPPLRRDPEAQGRDDEAPPPQPQR